MSFIDFDAAWSEHQAASDPPSIKVHGVTHVLPASLPAKVVLHATRWAADNGADLTLEYALEHFRVFLSPEVVDGWIEAGMTQAQVFELYLRTSALYRARATDSGEARPPVTGDSPGTSSKDGLSSPPTGSGTDGAG